MATATKTAAKKKPARKRASKTTRPDGQVRQPNVTAKKGDLVLVRHGQEWEPIACGEHRAVPPFDATKRDHTKGTHLGRPELRAPKPAGYDPKCEACQAELASTVEHADRHAGVPSS